MKQNIIVLSAHSYSVNENGRLSEGTSVRYLPIDHLNPMKDDKGVGMRPAKANLPLSWKDLFVAAPAMYEAEMIMNVGSDGKAAMTITHIDFLCPVTLTMNESAPAKK